jgi:ABC-type polar amino acid transport system ATPase subunit
MALVQVDRVLKRYGSEIVLDRVSLGVEAGRVLVVIGPSRSGKSTLLRCIAGLESIQEGNITVDGKLAAAGTTDRSALRTGRYDIGMVFQQFNLFPHLTVLENVVLAPRRVKRMPLADAEALAVELLRRVGLEDKRTVYPWRLSGGQQ